MSATYKSSGVDISQGNRFVDAIQKDMKATKSAAVIARKGLFGSLFSLDTKKYKNPVLVSSTDGVGTKLLLAKELGIHNTVGIDLVAMNVNDVLCVGAKPLFFLDYIACGKIQINVLKNVVSGIAQGCKESDCSLIGGETAEMPGLYSQDEYDLAGFTVGVVEKNKIIDGSAIKEGDRVIGLPSSGLHSNGYSLARYVLSKSDLKKWGKVLLQPTRIYVKDVLKIISRFNVKGIAHITGGAYYEKLTKILPKGMCFNLNSGAWPVPEIFYIIQKKGRISDHEMHRTFNMGLGMVLVVADKDFNALKSFLNKERIEFYSIGIVGSSKKHKVIFN